MKSNPLPHALDTADGFFNTAGDGVFASLLPSTVYGGGSPFSNFVPVIVPEEAAQAQTAVAASGSGGTGSVVAETSGSGVTINLLFDAAAMAAPASFRAGIEQAASILAATITDKITVNIKIDYSGTGGGAAAGPDNGYYESYSSIRADLAGGATVGDPTFDALPTGSTVQGQSSIAVWNAQLKLFGLLPANSTTTDDASATFATDINSNLLVGVALHELTHAMGRVPYGAPYSSSPDIFDLYRFTSAGTILINGASTAPAAYFSVDGGTTKIADLGQNSDPSDFLNSGVQGGNDPFNEYYSGSTLQSLTTADKEMLDALGFHLATPVATTIQTDTNSAGSISLVELSNDFYLQSATSAGTGVELKYGGTPVVAGEFAPSAPVGAAALANGGYEVAFKNASTGQFSIWQTDSNGNFLSSAVYSGTSAALETLETSFHQDLNGDGVIGIPAGPATTVIQTDVNSFGSTSLTEVGSNFYLYNSSGTGPELKFGGTAVAAAEFNPYVMVGAALTASGYEIAWQIPGTEQFSIWQTDSSGNYLSYSVYTGSSPVLQSLEASFHQDLNGDGVIGLPAGTNLIQTDTNSFGSTSLVEVGSNFYLESAGNGSGPELKYGGGAVVASVYSPYTPVGAVQTSTGYDVAWQIPGTEQFSIWTTNSSGNFTSYTVYSGSSPVLQSLETTFHQDLNGDGVIGLPAGTTLIQTDTNSLGSTSLVEVGNNFFLESASTGAGPELKYGGAAVVAAVYSPYTPVGAAQTASGYEVAWQIPGTETFSIWQTDSSGNFLSYSVYSGTSAALETLETSFHQDLNGDGVIGVPSTTGPTKPAAVVTAANNDTFVFAPDPTGMHSDAVASAVGNQHAEFFQDAPTPNPSHVPFQWANEGPFINYGSHDSIISTNLHVADLHDHGFVIH